MKLGRTKQQPEITTEDAELVLEVALMLRDALALHRRALDTGAPREEMLALARRIAALDRWVLIELETSDGALFTRIPDPLQPFAALWPLRRVGYGLTALAQEPPDTAAALTADELDSLVVEELAEWHELALGGAKVRGWE
jgi:hypothetical protein